MLPGVILGNDRTGQQFGVWGHWPLAKVAASDDAVISAIASVAVVWQRFRLAFSSCTE
jgi:hypothetical protein